MPTYTRKRTKLILGVGINDADYPVQPRVDGKVTRCPFYVTWKSVLTRCFCLKTKARWPGYENTTICEEWKTFSVFKAWMESQDWEGKQLDKDILFPGNMEYNPDRCVFVTSQVNSFILDRKADRGEWPLGVHWNIRREKFYASIGNGRGGVTHLGVYDCPQEAHKAWLREKRRMAVILASEQSDPRVAKAIIDKYENYTEKEEENADALFGPGTTGQREIYTGCDNGSCLACSTL